MPLLPLLDSLAALPDPRRAHRRRHRLGDLLFVALCATLCGADSFGAIERWGRAKRAWLTERLSLEHGVASHDTFRRVFGLLDPEALLACFAAWTREVAARTGGEVVALDGKTLRGSLDAANGRAALHLVSAWACDSRVSLGQQRLVGDKGNEVTALPELLKLLSPSGCLVTADAMGCQREVAGAAVAQGADYLLALKANHPALLAAAERFFERSRAAGWRVGEGALSRPVPHHACRSVEKGHGRVEVRRCFVAAAGAWLDPEARWPRLQSVACVECERTVGRGRREAGRRFFLSSLPAEGAGSGRVARRVLRAGRPACAAGGARPLGDREPPALGPGRDLRRGQEPGPQQQEGGAEPGRPAPARRGPAPARDRVEDEPGRQEADRRVGQRLPLAPPRPRPGTPTVMRQPWPL
jgi:hypothetical protein